MMAARRPTTVMVDMAFPAAGRTIPGDPCYLAYASVCAVIPELHGRSDYGIHPIHGVPMSGRRLALNRSSRLVFRTPVEMVGLLIRLSGRQLQIGSDRVVLGAPDLRALRPSPTLVSRLVVIKDALEPEPFLEVARRQMAELGVEGTVRIPDKRGAARFEGRSPGPPGPLRRTIRIRDREVVGFAVTVEGLSDDASVLLQAAGLGGRRRFGCGLLVPPGPQKA